jgi:hypothetical protein
LTRSQALRAPAKVWTITIPDWRPALANELLKWHYMKAATRKKSDARTIEMYARLCCGTDPFLSNPRGRFGVIGLERKRRVTIAIQYPPGGRRCDPDAPLKSTLDAIKTAGLIVDDSTDWCDCEMPKITSGRRLETTITIQDLPA